MLNDRLSALGDYPFRRLAALLAGAEPPAGLAPLIMSVGEPQLPVPGMIAEILMREAAGFGKYPPAAGSPDFRTACAGFLTRRYHLPAGMIDPARHIVPTPGTREALFQIALAVVPSQKAGQQPAVCMPNPFYQVYLGASVVAGAETVLLDAPAENGFLPDLDRLDPALLDRTALFYLCTPSNPQGTVADAAYLDRLLELARQHDFVLALDECYAEIYREVPPPGGLEAAMRAGGALDNLIVFHSLSKRSSSPGLRSGFVAGDERVIATLLRLMEYGGAGLPLPIQAASAALWDDDSHVLPVRAAYNENFAIAERCLGNRFGFSRPPGGFFLWLDVGDGEQAALTLWRDAGLRTLPGRYLARDAADGSNPGARYLRVALVHPPAVTTEALGRLAATL